MEYDEEHCPVCGESFSPLQFIRPEDMCVSCRQLTEVERWCIKYERERIATNRDARRKQKSQ